MGLEDDNRSTNTAMVAQALAIVNEVKLTVGIMHEDHERFKVLFDGTNSKDGLGLRLGYLERDLERYLAELERFFIEAEEAQERAVSVALAKQVNHDPVHWRAKTKLEWAKAFGAMMVAVAAIASLLMQL